MAGQAKHTSRNRKIEPLNWAEAANSPALKGMMSFLDIKPEEVRSGHFKDVPNGHDSRIDPIGESLTGSDTLIAAIEEKPIAPKAVIEMRPITGIGRHFPTCKSRTIRLLAMRPL